MNLLATFDNPEEESHRLDNPDLADVEAGFNEPDSRALASFVHNPGGPECVRVVAQIGENSRKHFTQQFGWGHALQFLSAFLSDTDLVIRQSRSLCISEPVPERVQFHLP